MSFTLSVIVADVGTLENSIDVSWNVITKPF
jgi:hypothetical protein